MKGVKLVGKEKVYINVAERLYKQLCNIRKLIKVIAEQLNDEQRVAVHDERSN